MSDIKTICIKDELGDNWFLYVEDSNIVLEKTDYKYNVYPRIVDDINNKQYRLVIDGKNESLYIVEDNSFLPIEPFIRDKATNNLVKFGVENNQIYLQTDASLPGRRTFKFKIKLIDTILIKSIVNTEISIKNKVDVNIPTNIVIKDNLTEETELNGGIFKNMDFKCKVVPDLGD